MSLGRLLGMIVLVVIFAAGGFAVVNWWQKPRVATGSGSQEVAAGSSGVVINRLEGCEGFNQSLDEAIALQNRIGHTHNSERLRGLKRDCRGERQEEYRAAPR
ncbi:hypothetical protein [Roseococcus sp. YIM B11640]|uniref:hypothetical protein n=1 Tax=Roseococcus sp. YIM B11640 TaxID=3133973 RepID=UPI003C7E3057